MRHGGYEPNAFIIACSLEKGAHTRLVASMHLADVHKVAVIGAGTMGAGIAQACAAAGFQVAMRDIDQRFVDGGFRRIREPLAKRVEKGKMTAAEVESILSKIRGVVDLKEAVAGAQVVIEAVFEKMDIKRELYAELDWLCPPEVVFASNTSSLSITEMANATKRADRVVGMHFFNPAPVMKLVEVIRGSETSDATVGPPGEVRPRGARRPEVRPRGVRLHSRMNLREAGPSGVPAAETSRAVGPRVADASDASRRPRRPRPR